MKICKVEGCENKHKAKGYCKRHYNQMYKYGKILKRTRSDPNEIIIKGDIAEIVLYDAKHKERARAIIDSEDVDKIKKYKWCIDKWCVKTVSKEKQLGIQHIIMETIPNKHKQIDHIDRDILNNCKTNLRFCTHAENNRNKPKPTTNTSGYKGVYWHKKNQTWVSQIGIRVKEKGKLEAIWLGTFHDKKKAAKAYNEAAIKYFGEFACLNNL